MVEGGADQVNRHLRFAGRSAPQHTQLPNRIRFRWPDSSRNLMECRR
jgi:hypothetical protein